ncbi:MAG TPA: T9SS type A sorting domain-containing protein, partial [Candidatus Krumholzibacterium sp.]|nr:T9SS type A sorting domain-containing protein [Candidatus Krumholzibacterium sp.]
GIPEDRILYSYVSEPLDTSREGKPVGIRAPGNDRVGYYLSFPLYYLDSADASSLIRKVLSDFGEVLVSVENPGGELPSSFRLYNAYPNPFNPATTLRFEVPVQSRVRLVLYDVLGRELETLVDEFLPPGRHEVRWNASVRASGMYYVRLRAGDGAEGFTAESNLIKLMLVK